MMKGPIIGGVLLSSVGIGLLGYIDFSATASIDLIQIGPFIAWVLIAGGISILLCAGLLKTIERKKWLRGYLSGAASSGPTDNENPDPDRPPAAKPHRRHRFDRDRTEWDIRS